MERFSADVRDLPEWGGGTWSSGVIPQWLSIGGALSGQRKKPGPNGLIIPAAYRVVLEADSLVV